MKRNIQSKDFVCLKDFDRVDEFLSKTFLSYGESYNWDNGRWAFTRFWIHPDEELTGDRSWEKTVRIWEDQEGEIVGVVHCEEPGDYFLETHPQYEDLQEEMLLWAMKNCKEYAPNLDKINTACSWRNDAYREILKKYKAVKHEGVDDHRVMILDEKLKEPVLPTGYHLVELDPEDKSICDHISWLYTHVWPESPYLKNGRAVEVFKTSKSYTKQGSYAIVNNEGVYVAFTMLWADSYGKIGHFYPMGISPDYKDVKIGKALLIHAINSLVDLGFEKVTLSAYYGELEEQIFSEVGLERTCYHEMYEVPLTE